MQDPLVNLLRKWAEARSEDCAAADAETVARISRELRRRRFLNLPETPRPRSPGGPVPPFRIAVAVLVLLLIAAGLWLTDGRKLPQTCRVAESGRIDLLKSTLFAPNPALFRDVNALFDYRLAWLADLPHGLEFSLASDETAAAVAAPPVAVKFVLLTRSSTDSRWRAVWQGTVYTPSDQWTEVRNSAGSVPRLGLWVYPLESGVFMIDSALDLRRPVRLLVRTSRVVTPGRPVRLIYVDSGTVQYQLYQSVVVLEKSVEAPPS